MMMDADENIAKIIEKKMKQTRILNNIILIFRTNCS